MDDSLNQDVRAHTTLSPNAFSMFAHRLRRWPNIETALDLCIKRSAFTATIASYLDFQLYILFKNFNSLNKPLYSALAIQRCLCNYIHYTSLGSGGLPESKCQGNQRVWFSQRLPVNPFRAGTVFIRQNLTSKVDRSTVRIKNILMTVDP